MNDQQALLNAIIATPEDDAPRLIYADWLDENADTPSKCLACDGDGVLLGCAGDRHNPTCHVCHGVGQLTNDFAERAKFIRVQCALLKLRGELQSDEPCGNSNCDCNKLAVLIDREEKLWNFGADGHWSSCDLMPTGSIKCIDVETISKETSYNPIAVYRRGFVDEVRLTLAQFMECGPTIAAQQPVTKWVMIDRKPVEFSSGPFVWLHEAVPSATDDGCSWALPENLFLCLEGWRSPQPHGTRTRMYDRSESEALKALQDACYRYARQGLAFLRPPTTEAP